MSRLIPLISVVVACASFALGQTDEIAWTTGEFRWSSSAPLVANGRETGDYHSIKDPSVVFAEGKWHLFCTVRGTARTHAIVHLSFTDWADAGKAPQEVLPCHPGYFCAPQVFYFAPQKLWYLVCQAADPNWTPNYQAAYATTRDISDPKSWSALKPLLPSKPSKANAWLDFWLICDDSKAYLFFTSLDGKMWRCSTDLASFPAGWDEPVVALQGDFVEASHTYRVRGDKPLYVTLVEAQNGRGWRYYKAYAADRLDGLWRPLAADKDHAFASMANVQQPDGRWTDVISHIELLRAGVDEKMEIDPHHLRVVFQGVLDKDRAGKAYGAIPWRLGLLRPVP